MSDLQQGQNNPLKKYYRQPKQFIKLPSEYEFYPEGTVDVPESGEVAVYPMTAKDELLFKTPDALLNGEATVRVIQSCVPAIKNAWAMPSIDIDAVLMAIRMATYGQRMSMKVVIPNTKIEKEFDLDLQQGLDKLLNARYDKKAFFEDMEIELRPLNYAQFTKASLKTFEEQRIANVVADQTIPEEEKVKQFQTSFNKLTDINLDMVTDTISSIKVDGQTVTDRKMIADFVANSSKQFFSTVLKHLEKQRDKFQLPTIVQKSTEEEKKQGAPDQYEVPVMFDTSNFFE